MNPIPSGLNCAPSLCDTLLCPDEDRPYKATQGAPSGPLAQHGAGVGGARGLCKPPQSRSGAASQGFPLEVSVGPSTGAVTQGHLVLVPGSALVEPLDEFVEGSRGGIAATHRLRDVIWSSHHTREGAEVRVASGGGV